MMGLKLSIDLPLAEIPRSLEIIARGHSYLAWQDLLVITTLRLPNSAPYCALGIMRSIVETQSYCTGFMYITIFVVERGV